MSAYSDLILATPGLVSYWRLDEASGQVIDTKGVVNGNVTNMTRAVPGLLPADSDRAIRSTGTSGARVTFPNHANLATAAVSVECWVQPTGALPASTAALVRRDISPGGYELEHNGSGRWAFNAYAAGGTRLAFTPPIGAAGVTQHIVATYSAADRARIYVNGVFIYAATQAGAALGAAATTTLFATDLSAPSFYGVMDEVAIYNTVLTAQQILDHYSEGARIPPAAVANPYRMVA